MAETIKPCVLWFTGLSGSGKSTLAEAVARELRKSNVKTEPLDGDVIREVFPKTGFTREEREHHLRWAGFIAGLLERNGVVVVASFVSTDENSRQFARSRAKRFIEVHVSTPLEECERRDVKGLYAKARRGEIQNFTGISDPYEAPSNPELRLDTTKMPLNEAVELVMKKIRG